MKAVKKGAHGAKVKEAMYGAKIKKAEMGGKLKEVPSNNKGLGKLPKEVRNKMGYMKNGGKVTGPDKKKKSVVTVDQDLKDLGNALKEGVKMITIPGYGAMKLADYLKKRKQGMNKTEIGKAMKSAGKAGGAETLQEMARKSGKLGMKKSMVKKPTMKRTMTKLVKTKDTRPYSKRPRPDYIPQTVRDKKKNEATPKMEYGGKVKDKMMYGGSMKKAMYGAKMKKKGMNKTEIGKAMKSAGKAGGAETLQEMARKSGKLGMKKSMVKKPTMKRTMTKLVKKKDTRPYSKRPATRLRIGSLKWSPALEQLRIISLLFQNS